MYGLFASISSGDFILLHKVAVLVPQLTQVFSDFFSLFDRLLSGFGIWSSFSNWTLESLG